MSYLTVKNLSIGDGSATEQPLVSKVCFSVGPGQTLGLAGESGSGKTLTACALCGLLPRPLKVLSGEINLLGQKPDPNDLRFFRGKRGRDIFLVFQSPASALDPTARVGRQIAEVLRNVRGWDRRRVRAGVEELLEAVGLSRDKTDAYPNQLSGGQRQRILLAMAFGLQPRILVADEPATGLDKTTQEQILGLLKKQQESQGTALIIISHDLRMLSSLAGQLVIMHRGEQVEAGATDEVLANPSHRHTKELVEAMHYLEIEP